MLGNSYISVRCACGSCGHSHYTLPISWLGSNMSVWSVLAMLLVCRLIFIGPESGSIPMNLVILLTRITCQCCVLGCNDGTGNRWGFVGAREVPYHLRKGDQGLGKVQLQSKHTVMTSQFSSNVYLTFPQHPSKHLPDTLIYPLKHPLNTFRT